MTTTTITADGTSTFTPERPGLFLFMIGITGGTDFGGGTVTISQNGINLFAGVAAAARHQDIYVTGGDAISMVMAGSTNPDLDIGIERQQTKTTVK